MQNYEERRQFKRIEDSFLVSYRIQSSRAAEASRQGQDAVAVDLSEGGVGLNAGEEIPVGAEVELQFKILNDFSATERDKRREFTLKAESRYCRLTQRSEYRVGLLFKNISEQDREFIATYVKDSYLGQWLKLNRNE